MRKIKPNKNLLGKVDRFKTEPSGSGLNPAKYNVIQEWRGKDNKKTNRHGIEVLSTKSVHKNVYYHWFFYNYYRPIFIMSIYSIWYFFIHIIKMRTLAKPKPKIEGQKTKQIEKK